MKVFYAIILIVWFALAYFFFNKYLTEKTPRVETADVVQTEIDSTDECVAALLFKDEAFKLVSKENFKFLKSNFNHNLLSPEFESSLLKVAKYLDENPSRKMKIKGLFLKEEENNTDYENLGLARAYSVKTYFLRLGVNSSQLLTSAKLANPECYVDNTLEKGIVVAFGK